MLASVAWCGDEGSGPEAHGVKPVTPQPCRYPVPCRAPCRLYGTPLDVLPGSYQVPVSVSGQGSSPSLGTLSGTVTVVVCVRPASAYTPPYFVAALNPVIVAPYGLDVAIGVRAWLRPGANATVSSVTGRLGGPLPAWLAYNASAGVVQGRPADSTSGDFMVDVRFAVNGTAADLVTLVVRVPCSPVVVPQSGVWPAGTAPAAYGGSGEDQGRAAAVATNGDVVLAGLTTSFGTGGYDAYVQRVHGGNGSVLWARTWGAAAGDYFWAVVMAANGDVVVAGGTESFGAGSTDAFILRLDGGNGSVVWSRTWGGISAENTEGLAMAANGDVLVAGLTVSFGAGMRDAVVLRLGGNDGSLLWARTWGGSGLDQANAVAMVANGDVVVTGRSDSAGAGGNDALVLRLNGGNGTLVWARTWGGPGNDYATSVALAANGEVVVVGYTNSFGTGNGDAFVLRLDGGNGSVVWARTWGGSGSDSAEAVAVTTNGDVAVVGSFSSVGAGLEAFVLLMSGGNGSVASARTWGGSSSDGAIAVAMAADGTVVVTGQTQSFGAGSLDAFVLWMPAAFFSSSPPQAGSSLSFGLAPGAAAQPVTSAALGSPVGAVSTPEAAAAVLSAVGSDVSRMVTRTLGALAVASPVLQVGGWARTSRTP
jgi:hypothetical protein